VGLALVRVQHHPGRGGRRARVLLREPQEARDVLDARAHAEIPVRVLHEEHAHREHEREDRDDGEHLEEGDA